MLAGENQRTDYINILIKDSEKILQCVTCVISQDKSLQNLSFELTEMYDSEF